MAASSLISQHGFGGLSMRMLAKEVGLTAPTLYGYFPSKAAVVEALAIEKVAIMRDFLLREAGDAEPGIPRLMAYARGYRRLALTWWAFYHMLLERPDSVAGEIVTQDEGTGRDLIRTVAEDVQAAIDQGVLGPVEPEQTILALWVTAHGFVSLELAGCPPFAALSAEEREAAYLQQMYAMLHGMATSASAVATGAPAALDPRQRLRF